MGKVPILPFGLDFTSKLRDLKQFMVANEIVAPSFALKKMFPFVYIFCMNFYDMLQAYQVLMDQGGYTAQLVGDEQEGFMIQVDLRYDLIAGGIYRC